MQAVAWPRIMQPPYGPQNESGEQDIGPWTGSVINVRSGPSPDHKILGQVQLSNVLNERSDFELTRLDAYTL